MHKERKSSGRGEWFVIGQFALFAMIAFGPKTACWLPAWGRVTARIGSVAGVAFLVAGSVLALAGILKLGRRNFTPFICPKAGSVMLEQGPYRLVRHPVYSGLFFMGFGWGLWVHSLLTIAYSILLFILLDAKARREEKWLEMRFPAYSQYRRRVRRFFPFLY